MSADSWTQTHSGVELAALMGETISVITNGNTLHHGVHVEFSQYIQDPGQTAIVLKGGSGSDYEDELLSVATVYLENSTPRGDEYVFIKDYSENEGLFDSLIAAGVLEDAHCEVPTGWVSAREARISDKWQVRRRVDFAALQNRRLAEYKTLGRRG